MITSREATIRNAMENTLIDCYDIVPIDTEYKEFFIIVQDDRTIEKHMKEMFPYNTPDLDECIHIIGGLEWGYYDEYMTCEECGILIHIGGYGTLDYWINDGYVLSGEFIRDNPDEYIEHLTNNYKDANVIFDEGQLIDLGWVNTNNDKYCRMFEHCDCPQSVLQETQEQYPEYNVLFSIIAIDPFETDYVAWIKLKEDEYGDM